MNLLNLVLWVIVGIMTITMSFFFYYSPDEDRAYTPIWCYATCWIAFILILVRNVIVEGF